MSPQRACAVLLALSSAVACANDPYPDQSEKRTISAEIYHFVCKRVAREYAPGDLSGTQFNGPCDTPSEADMEDESKPRLRAMLQRRAEIVAALEQAIGDQSVTGSAEIADGELKDFLRDLVPFYDDDTLPVMTQKIAGLLDQVLDNNDPRAQAVIDRLAAISPRMGYRPPSWTLGAMRPFLSYERLDALSRTMLTLFGEGGAANEEFVAMLKAAALELADEAKAKTPGEATTLHVLLDLLLTVDPALAPSGAPKLWTVRRDARGLAKANVGSPFVDSDGDGLADTSDDTGLFSIDDDGATGSPYPFLVAGAVDTVEDRDGSGLALSPSRQPMFDYYDANQTILAAGMREAKPLLTRDKAGEPSTVENLSRGLRALLGPNTSRSYDFGDRAYAFQGPDLAKAPILDLLHAVGTLAKQPETRDALELVKELMKQDELEVVAAAPLYAGLQIDARADDAKHDKAFITGVDGKKGSPHEFWDDALVVGARMLKRPGLVQGLIEAFATPLASAQGQLYADWMKYNDVVAYKNAPFKATGEGGKYTEQEAADLNASVADFKYSKEVDRTLPDTSMNRSIWQRTMSLLHTINGSKLCNKEGAVIAITQPLPLQFPIGGTYKKCDFVEIADPGEAYVRALLGKMKITLKDQGLNDLAAFGSALGIVGSTAQIQEQESQIKDFNDKPTGQALARFMFGPNNKFIDDLFGDVLTNDNVPLKQYEPYALFPMEVEDQLAVAEGKAQSFITSGMPLVTAFDDHELRDGDALLDGYMFGHFLDFFHMHWAAPKAGMCPDAVQPGVSEGCTQSLDANARFYSPQSNIVSYEPLIIEAMADEQLTVILQRAAAKLAAITLSNGKTGTQVLAGFVEMMLRNSDQLAYRDGRTWAASNTCVMPRGADPKVAPEKCDCPTGATADADGNCKLADRTVPRGKIVPLSPAYLLLDALKGFDDAFAKPELAARLAPWRAARSVLVDRFLGIEKVSADDFVYKFKNKNSRSIAVKGLEWAIARIDAHATDLQPWADGLTKRASTVLEHPLVATGLDVLDVFWDAKDAGDEFSAVASYLMDPDKEAFAGIVVAAADTLTFLDSDPDLTPIVRFASLAVAPNAFSALDSDVEPNVAEGVAYRGLELTRKVVGLHTDETVPSPLSKLLKNLVLTNDNEDSAIVGQSPIEVFFDSVAEINRVDANESASMPMKDPDLRESLGRMSSFLMDNERGLERIYRVIKSRNVNSQVQ